MVLFFSGTGNSRHTAQRIAARLSDQLVCVNDRIKAGDVSPVQTEGRLIIVTPTYAWRIPRVVEDWLRRTPFPGTAQVWFVMTCGSEIGNAAKFNRALCAEMGIPYMGTAGIVMPENYIAMFHAPDADEAREIVARADPAIQRAASLIAAGQEFPPPRRNLYDRFMRQALSHEQHLPPGGKARLGGPLYALHGLHLLLSHRGHRVREEERRSAPLPHRGPL